LRKKVLLVEDNISLGGIIKDTLEEIGYEVKFISVPEEVLNTIKEFSPDVIVLDVILPQKNGISILTDIMTYMKKNPPVVIMSGLKDDVVKHDAKLFGAFTFIEKPFEIGKLIKVIEEAMEGKK